VRKLHLWVALATLLSIASAAAQVYPSRMIKIVVPLPPGATADTLPRIIADKLTLKWGQPVIIENRPGAAQNLGAEVVAKAEPDGYTLLATPQGPLVISQHFYPKLGFDPEAFVPVTIMAVLSSTLVVNPKVPASTLQELIAFAKANPDKLSYASPGTGSPPHLAAAMLATAAGIRMVHVPYKGLVPAMTDLLAGHVDMMFDNLGNTLSHIKDGRLRVLAISTEKRIPEFPEVPAVAEMYPGVVYTSWFAIVAPPKTPPEIASKLSSAINEVLRMPDVAKRLKAMSTTPGGQSPAQTAALFAEESQRWRKVIASAGIKAE
jgi:tripartite-type tricarboxylate transporter receptor subunit TctC